MIENCTTGSHMTIGGGPEVLVIGTGYAGNMRIPDSVRSVIENHEISIIAEKTAAATTIFNQLYSEGKNVAGAFHLTC
jgi:hypothetical protein